MSNTNHQPLHRKLSEEQAVIDALGSSGQKVVDFVHVTIADMISANAEELRAAVERFNLYVTASEAKESGNTELLTSIRDALNKALGAHSTVARALNAGQEVSPAAGAEAVQATAAVAELELEWKAMVDQTLANHEQRLTHLEENRAIPIPAPALVPAPEPSLSPEPVVVESTPSGVALVEQRLDESAATTRYVTKFVNPKVWGGLAWALAALGFIVGGFIVMNIWGGFFPGVPAAIQWVRWLTLLLIPFFGLFAGGAIGSYIESQQQPARETTVA
ncbi:hypothetical protein H7X69_03125 [Candidatus Saccharibacteria bacterium]|nr:hypothetical protein [Candidatus Saccharibacteria bacterium]